VMGVALAAGRKLVFPELLAGLGVERAQVVIHSGGSEHKVARAHHGPAESDRTRVHPRNPASQRDIPDFSPEKRSTAATVPQGGALHGSPLGELPKVAPQLYIHCGTTATTRGWRRAGPAL